MSSSPLSYNTEEGRYTLQLHNGPHAGIAFAAKLSACPSPICPCTDVTFSCAPLAPVLASAFPPFTFVLDIEERCVKQHDESDLSPQAFSLASGLVAEMNGQDWKDLDRYFYTYKEKQTETVDPKTLDVHFPPETLIDPSMMVGYKDILPFAKSFAFTVGTAHWLVDELYCVNPQCTCRDVTFDFLRIDLPPEGNAHVAQQLTATYDSRRSTFKPQTAPWPDKPTLKTLTQSLRKAHPNLAAEIRKRRTTLRTLYRKAQRREHGDTPAPTGPATKTGPNEPCPCGSGKKHKKCCGRIA